MYKRHSTLSSYIIYQKLIFILCIYLFSTSGNVKVHAQEFTTISDGNTNSIIYTTAATTTSASTSTTSASTTTNTAIVNRGRLLLGIDGTFLALAAQLELASLSNSTSTSNSTTNGTTSTTYGDGDSGSSNSSNDTDRTMYADKVKTLLRDIDVFTTSLKTTSAERKIQHIDTFLCFRHTVPSSSAKLITSAVQVYSNSIYNTEFGYASYETTTTTTNETMHRNKIPFFFTRPLSDYTEGLLAFPCTLDHPHIAEYDVFVHVDLFSGQLPSHLLSNTGLSTEAPALEEAAVVPPVPLSMSMDMFMAPSQLLIERGVALPSNAIALQAGHVESIAELSVRFNALNVIIYELASMAASGAEVVANHLLAALPPLAVNTDNTDSSGGDGITSGISEKFPLFVPRATDRKHTSASGHCEQWWPLNGSEIYFMSGTHKSNSMARGYLDVIYRCNKTATNFIATRPLKDHFIVSMKGYNVNGDQIFSTEISHTALEFDDESFSGHIEVMGSKELFASSFRLESTIYNYNGVVIAEFAVNVVVLLAHDVPPSIPISVPFIAAEFRNRNELGHVLNSLDFTGTIAEVGVQKGFYASQLLRTWSGCRYIGIDPWPDAPTEDYIDRANKFNRTDDLRRAEINISPYTDRAMLLRMTSAEAVGYICDNSLDAVYIDAIHTYYDVMQDMQMWWSKVRPGGLMLGHDYGLFATTESIFSVAPAVKEFSRRMRIALFSTYDDEKNYNTWYMFKPV